ncbi:multiple coagulation factor deficiency protein 2 homolog isoform X2 [Atheta coriaria]|uniref:multiple coagulation factor deficiency protein 2 homolog isoform X2 n=1 Tax=Dalotia coriaria TaxID=877792 RepID=UPI0031F4487F
MQLRTSATSALLALLLNILFILSQVHGQGRVAPGVPPQHYQQVPQQQYQPPPPQHQQMQQPHHQQQQQQQQFQHQPQQPQFQQQQVPAHHQQVPHQQPGGHHHGHHEVPSQVFNPGNIQQEKEHIAEHMEVPMDTSKMTDQELQFHYFKMHDADNNNKLDGCELIKSLIHWHVDDKATDKAQYQPIPDATIEATVDPLLKTLDLNNDGHIDFPEFKSATPNIQA